MDLLKGSAPVVRPPETRFEELKRYVSFIEEDARAAAAFCPIAAPEFPRIAREFYDRIREHEEAHTVLQGEEQIQRLQRSLVRWMGRLCSGVYDEAYFEETMKIGRVHVTVGLPQRYMFTAMALIRVALIDIADKRMGDAAHATRHALTRLIDLDLAIMMEAYREDSLARAKRLEQLETKELSRTLARAEHRYKSAVELARVMIIGLDARGEIRLFNREAEHVTGFARDEVNSKSFADGLLQEDLVAAHGARIRRALAGSAEIETLESSFRTRTGKYRDVRLQLAYAPPLPSSADPTGSQGGEEEDDIVLFAIGTDVTEERARADQRRQTEKLAAVGTLAAGLAHEIRNPLNGAQLHVAFLGRALQRSGADEDVREAVRVVGDEIHRLASLVTEFLDFARPRPPQRKAISVFALCERAAQLAVAQAERAHVKLEKDLPTRDMELLADGAKLEQVLLNLLSNAVEAMAPNGGGRVILRARRQPRHCHLEVEDNGPGLPDPEAPIFDPFFSTKPEGTGLGLAITHRIVTDHEGSITVESAPGRTIFRVALPLEA